MPWTAPVTTWEEGDIVAAQDMNAIGENLLALKSPPTALVNLNEPANFTTASTSFVSIDPVRLTLTLLTSGGAVLVTFAGSITLSTPDAIVYLDLLVDGLRAGGDDGILTTTASSTIAQNASFAYWLPTLAAGVHTIALQWKVSTGSATLWAGAGTPLADLHPQFAAREVS